MAKSQPMVVMDKLSSSATNPYSVKRMGEIRIVGQDMEILCGIL